MPLAGWRLAREIRLRYGSTDNERLAASLHVSVEYLLKIAQRFCLAKDKLTFKGRPMPRWDPVDEAYLKDNYRRTPNVRLARELGRSTKAVNSKAHHLGLSKDPERLMEMGRQNVAIRYGQPYSHPK